MEKQVDIASPMNDRTHRHVIAMQAGRLSLERDSR
jgi:hypothetical protein